MPTTPDNDLLMWRYECHQQINIWGGHQQKIEELASLFLICFKKGERWSEGWLVDTQDRREEKKRESRKKREKLKFERRKKKMAWNISESDSESLLSHKRILALS